MWCVFIREHTYAVYMKSMILVQSDFFPYVVCAPLALIIIQIHKGYVRDTERKEC